MKKKITALILVIPLIFMFTVFSAGQAAAISVPVSVSSITIDNKPENNTFYADIATYDKEGGEEPFVFQVTVNPTAAANKNYKFVSSDSNVATVDANNKLCVHDVGKADITVRSENGGFTDKIAVVVTSTVVLRYDLLFKGSNNKDVTLTAVSGNNDYQYKVQLSTGTYKFTEKNVHPSTIANYGAAYASSNTNVATISPIGDVVVRSSGSTILSCEIQGIKKSVLVEATSPVSSNKSGIAIEGKDNATFELSTTETTFEALVETATAQKPTVVEKSPLVANVDFQPVTGTYARSTVTLWKMTVILFPGLKPTDEVVKIVLDGGKSDKYELNFIFADSVLSVYSQDSKDLAGGEDRTKVEMLKFGEEYIFYPEILPASQTADYKYDWTSDNDKIVITNGEKPGFVKISATSIVANAKITLTAKEGETVVCEPYSFKVTFINFYSIVDITDSGRGIEQVLAIGEKQYNSSNQLVGYQHQFNTIVKTDKDAPNVPLSDEEFEVSSSDNVTAEIVDGKLVLTEILPGEMAAWVKLDWKYNDVNNTNLTYTFNFNAIDEAVQIGEGEIKEPDKGVLLSLEEGNKEYLEEKSKYEAQEAEIEAIARRVSPHLEQATQAGLPVVLVGDVYLRSNINVKKIKTTADWTYYANNNMGQPTVSYLIEFKNNVFGNGYFINAHNVTTKENGSFNGPLNFAALGDLASVKAQDNISFLVTNDNVIIDNIQLKGCRDDYFTWMVNGELELYINELNNIGTVLELMSDAKVLNSRIRNGRTCIRAFGRKLADGVNPVVSKPLEDLYDIAAERIHPVISNCIVQQAREFLLKVGTNRALLGGGDSELGLSPKLGNYNTPATGATNVEDSFFYDKYVLTDITVKDTVFDTSGLFCIGIESHFAGPFLNNAVSDNDILWETPPFNGEFGKIPMREYVSSMLESEGWNGLAATSYAAKIMLEGEVEFFNWSEVDEIDSSTLIDANSFPFLDLRVNEMIRRAAKNDNKLNVLFDINKIRNENNEVVKEEEVLHGGICFYGGGKNYSEVIGANDDLELFKVNLSILAKGLDPNEVEDGSEDEVAFQQGTFLPYAAGTEDFRFMMYTNNINSPRNCENIKSINPADITDENPARPDDYRNVNSLN